MNKRELLAAWFRQQAELSMPDLVLTPDLCDSLVRQAVLPAQSSVAAPQSTASSSNRTATMTPPSATATGSGGSLKSRLSGLRPVEQLVKMARDSEPDTPAATHTGAVESSPVISDKREALKELYLKGCTQCHLAQTRKNYVFGGGNAEAPVMVIGEAPGHEEDEQGVPFVGAAGQLLTSMLAAIKLDRNKDVFIGNILKCRPPGNRNPEASEIVTCLPLLRKQIEIIAPTAILLLGRIAAHALLDINDSIAKMRGKVFSYNGISTMVIYHPAALLRNAKYKRPAWEDLQQFQQLLASSGIYGSLHEK